MPLEPAADDREGRHVAAGAADADPEPESQIAEPDTINHRSEAQPEAEDYGTGGGDDPRAETVDGAASERARRVKDSASDREEH